MSRSVRDRRPHPLDDKTAPRARDLPPPEAVLPAVDEAMLRSYDYRPATDAIAGIANGAEPSLPGGYADTAPLADLAPVGPAPVTRWSPDASPVSVEAHRARAAALQALGQRLLTALGPDAPAGLGSAAATVLFDIAETEQLIGLRLRSFAFA